MPTLLRHRRKFAHNDLMLKPCGHLLCFGQPQPEHCYLRVSSTTGIGERHLARCAVFISHRQDQFEFQGRLRRSPRSDYQSTRTILRLVSRRDRTPPNRTLSADTAGCENLHNFQHPKGGCRRLNALKLVANSEPNPNLMVGGRWRQFIDRGDSAPTGRVRA
jgi:hypothetical protein